SWTASYPLRGENHGAGWTGSGGLHRAVGRLVRYGITHEEYTSYSRNDKQSGRGACEGCTTSADCKERRDYAACVRRAIPGDPTNVPRRENSSLHRLAAERRISWPTHRAITPPPVKRTCPVRDIARASPARSITWSP